ncbi:MAG: FG-GAP repeat protein [Planctomycetes bacterium]|nr:FG-GAP repeat protein [Planctomycetota bacterium]
MMPSPNRPSNLSISVYVLLGLSLWPTVPARAALIPRTPLPKRPYVLYPNDPSQMAIKFVDAMKARTQQGQLTADDQDMLDEVTPVIAEHNLLFTKLIQLPYPTLTNLEQRAATYSGKAQPDLGGMMVVHFPGAADELTVANDLLALDAVEYVINRLKELGLDDDIPPTTPLLWGNQGYFGPDPGLDMDYSWSKASIGGLFNTRAKGIKLTQVEAIWDLGHEDLVDRGVFEVRAGIPSVPGANIHYHGNAVLGILAAQENTDGIAGQASESTIQVSGRTLLEGDINADGVVNPLDVGFIQARIDCPVGTGKIDCDASDRNLDGVVDAADVELVMAQFGSDRSHRGPSGGVQAGECDVFAGLEVRLDLRNPLDGGGVIDTWVGRATELQIVLTTVYTSANVAFVNIFLDQHTLSGAADSLQIEALLPGLPEPWIYDRSAFTLPAAIDAPGENEYGLVLGDNTGCGLFGPFEQPLDTLVFIASSPSEHEITFELGARAPGIFTADLQQYIPCYGWLIPQYCIGVGDTDNPLVIHATVCDGDANRDGFINPLDFGFILARFGCFVDTGDTTCDMADVNADAIVDPLDLEYVLSRLGCNSPCPAHDCNGNGVEDSCDIESGLSDDCQSNNIPDECELDINDNGVPDECESCTTDADCDDGDACNGQEVCDGICFTVLSSDCNDNGIEDYCDIASGESNDCQPNGVPDNCDLANSNSEDCTDNGIPDECEFQPDCNENGLADFNDICTLSADASLELKGVEISDRAGVSVSAAGDINGDGYDDVVIGCEPSQLGSNHEGKSYVVFGSENMEHVEVLELDDLDGSNGFFIREQQVGSKHTVSGAGDVNNDGFPDLFIGAPEMNPNGLDNAGQAYVIFGGTSVGATGLLEVESLDGSNGFVINGMDAQDNLGISVSGGADFNGDGLPDLLLGASGADPSGIADAGEVYVIFGKSNLGSEGVIELSDLDGSNGFVIQGTGAADNAGVSVSGAGDINGDGLDDLIIGANLADPNGQTDAGESYVIFGHRSLGADGVLILSDLDGTNGFVVRGVAPFDESGFSVGGAGDVNADGFDDLILGAYMADANDVINAGESYLLFGEPEIGASGSINLASLDGNNGIVIMGGEPWDQSGFSVGGAGDFNNDGFADIVIGAPDEQFTTGFGKSYLILGGQAIGTDGTIQLSDLDETTGQVMKGVGSYDHLGHSVTRAGDLNHDGLEELIVGAPGAWTEVGGGVGRVYIIWGVANCE